MTAEIALLNRSAVALAADSAVTLSYFSEGRPTVRYSKDANKIFHISNSRPVGLMIYQAAALQGMPWEVIAKGYRDRRGEQRFDTLEEYAKDLFSFIVLGKCLFPADNQARQFSKNIELSAVHICRGCSLDNDLLSSSTEEKEKHVSNRLRSIENEIDSMEFINSIDEGIIIAEAARRKTEITNEFAGYPTYDAVADLIDHDDLFRVATKFSIKKNSAALTDTGVVIAGYGENEYFPRIIRYKCYGVILDNLLYDELQDEAVTISHDNVSAIQPIAQSNMVNTFIHGSSMSALVKMDELFGSHARKLLDQISEATGMDLNTTAIRELQESALLDFSSEMTHHLWEEHTQPLRQVIGMLSISELAELAETLISIESLKERVTRPTESVSGPIDVAVISKSDGFIWIKRKYYFDMKLNPRYLSIRR